MIGLWMLILLRLIKLNITKHGHLSKILIGFGYNLDKVKKILVNMRKGEKVKSSSDDTNGEIAVSLNGVLSNSCGLNKLITCLFQCIASKITELLTLAQIISAFLSLETFFRPCCSAISMSSFGPFCFNSNAFIKNLRNPMES